MSETRVTGKFTIGVPNRQEEEWETQPRKMASNKFIPRRGLALFAVEGFGVEQSKSDATKFHFIARLRGMHVFSYSRKELKDGFPDPAEGISKQFSVWNLNDPIPLDFKERGGEYRTPDVRNFLFSLQEIVEGKPKPAFTREEVLQIVPPWTENTEHTLDLDLMYKIADRPRENGLCCYAVISVKWDKKKRRADNDLYPKDWESATETLGHEGVSAVDIEIQPRVQKLIDARFASNGPKEEEDEESETVDPDDGDFGEADDVDALTDSEFD